jgi:hypothetical protein
MRQLTGGVGQALSENHAYPDEFAVTHRPSLWLMAARTSPL